MKTVLLITAEESQRLLYEAQLKKHFRVVCAESTKDAPTEVDAVIYDLPKYPSSEDFECLSNRIWR